MIGTGIAIAIALGSAGAQAAGSIYGAKKAADVNEKAIAAQERDAARAATLEREESLRREQARKDMLAADDRRWNDFVRVNEPHWRTGQQTLASLWDLAGGGGGGPMAAPPPAPPPPVAPASATPAAGAPMALADLAGGATPQAGVPTRSYRPPMALPTPVQPRNTLMDLASLAALRRRPVMVGDALAATGLV